MNRIFNKIYSSRLLNPWLFIIVCLAMFFAFFKIVDLSPQIGSNFFFSNENPRLQENKLLYKIFPGESSLVVINAAGNIEAPAYYQNVKELSDKLSQLPSVSDVKSLTKGPVDLRSAKEGPLWKRIVVAENGRSSNLLLLIDDVSYQKTIARIEDIVLGYDQPDFRIRISGVPYVVEMIRRRLLFDMKVFSLIACIMFGLIVILMFRSLKILLGMFIACISACVLSLMITNYLGVKIGILTANIITIIFVLTISHIIFLTHNWLHSLRREQHGPDAIRNAVSLTFSASFWCMATTLLGFLSLLFVGAKPLRELGFSGSVGTIVAISMAYIVFPFFLPAKQPKIKVLRWFIRLAKSFFLRYPVKKTFALLILCVCVVPGLFMLNTDPSLLSYFKKGGNLREGLEYVDDNGGSTPLDIVIRDERGHMLTERQSYNRLWHLHKRLEDESSIGSIISLPVILAEGKRRPMASVLTFEALTKILEFPAFGSVSQAFITKDRISTHFLIRMRESGRTRSRYDVVESIKGIISDHGFIAEIVSGLYLLQSELASLVSKSILNGLWRLLFIFFFISWHVSKNIKTAISMTLAVTAVPVFIYGIVGLLRMPVDIISAPAANVAIAIGIDSMIHTVTRLRRYRRLKREGDVWGRVRKEMWQPVFYAMIIICMGFAIFFVSAFPPTQRFGLFIVVGTIMAAFSTIFILPFFDQLSVKSRLKKSL
jgi:uncharacterized protein